MGCSQNSFGLGVRVVRVTGNPALVTGVGSLQVVIPLVLEISETFLLGVFPFFFHTPSSPVRAACEKILFLSRHFLLSPVSSIFQPKS